MQHGQQRRAPRLSARALSLAALLLVAATAAAGARQGGIPPVPRRDPEAERIRQEQKREMQLRAGGAEPPRPADEGAVRAAVKQLGEDFKRVQVIRNELARALATQGALDYGRVSAQAAEVVKRALRMRAYLALRAPDGGKEQAPRLEGAQMKEALARLCRSIDSFVASPRFKSSAVVDVEGDAKTGRDLGEIISLSTALRESAARLGRDGAGARRAGH